MATEESQVSALPDLPDSRDVEGCREFFAHLAETKREFVPKEPLYVYVPVACPNYDPRSDGVPTSPSTDQVSPMERVAWIYSERYRYVFGGQVIKGECKWIVSPTGPEVEPDPKVRLYAAIRVLLPGDVSMPSGVRLCGWVKYREPFPRVVWVRVEDWLKVSHQ